MFLESGKCFPGNERIICSNGVLADTVGVGKVGVMCKCVMEGIVFPLKRGFFIARQGSTLRKNECGKCTGHLLFFRAFSWRASQCQSDKLCCRGLPPALLRAERGQAWGEENTALVVHLLPFSREVFALCLSKSCPRL